MPKILAKDDFTLKGKFYFKDKEVPLDDIDLNILLKLNENGFIKSLSTQELLELENYYKIETKEKNKENKNNILE